MRQCLTVELDRYRELGVDRFQLEIPKNERESLVRFVDDVAPTV